MLIPLIPTPTQTQDMLSNYHGSNRLVEAHSPWQAGLRAGLNLTLTLTLTLALTLNTNPNWQSGLPAGLNLTASRGCNICDVVPKGYPNIICPPGNATDTSMIPAAVAAARAADAAVRPASAKILIPHRAP